MKWWKKGAAAFLGALFCVQYFCPARGENVPVMLGHPLAMALQATGAELDRGYFVGSARIANRGDAEMARLAADALAAFGLEAAHAVEEQSCGEAGRSYSLHARMGRTAVNVALRRARQAQSAQDTLDLKVELWQENLQAEEIAPLEDKLRAAIENLDGIPRISTCLEGHLDGKLRKDQRDLALEDAFDAIGAKITARTETEMYGSYAGYTPLLGAAARAGGLRLNLNIAARYHAYDGSTHVHVGTPVILVSY